MSFHENRHSVASTLLMSITCIYACTVTVYDVLQVTNAFVKSIYYVTEGLM